MFMGLSLVGFIMNIIMNSVIIIIFMFIMKIVVMFRYGVCSSSMISLMVMKERSSRNVECIIEFVWKMC